MTTATDFNKVEMDLAAEMRLAFTRATVNFPKSLNTTPIAITISHVFADVFYELKRLRRWSVRQEYQPLSENLLFQISGLVDLARDRIMAKSVPGEVTVGMSTEQARKMRGLVAGLDRNSATELIKLVREGNPAWVQRRAFLLTNRRNQLANELTADAMRIARSYFLSEVPDAGSHSG